MVNIIFRENKVMRISAVKKLSYLFVAIVILTLSSVTFKHISETTNHDPVVQGIGEVIFEQRQHLIISDESGMKQTHLVGIEHHNAQGATLEQRQRIDGDIGKEQHNEHEEIIDQRQRMSDVGIKQHIGHKDSIEQVQGLLVNGETTPDQLELIGETTTFATRVSRTIPPFYPLNGTGTSVSLTTETDRCSYGISELFCKTERVLYAIIPIYSAPENVLRRQAIRDTVGKECLRFKCKLFFIIGISGYADDKEKLTLNHTANLAVKQECDKNRDILMINKIDTYRDLNNKVVGMLDWLIKFCQEPKYVIHIIDDTYPNLDFILKQLNRITASANHKFIIGKPASSLLPVRRKDSGLSKWYLSQTEYPYNKFPDYIVGTAYAFLNTDCHLLREKVHSAEYIWIEDVWITGMVAKAARFRRISFNTYPGDLEKPNIDNLAKLWNTYPYAHNVSPETFYEIYSISKASIH